MIDRKAVLAWVAALVAVALVPGSVRAAPCDAAEYRQFDFWLGEWDVRNQLNKQAEGTGAVNRISTHNRGCVILEEFTTKSGYSGTSINFYNRLTEKWHQVWMDSGGAALFQSGGIVDGNMVLTEKRADGSLSRIIWGSCSSA